MIPRACIFIVLGSLSAALGAQPAPRLEYEEVWIPAKTSGIQGEKAIKLEATLYKPKGEGPFPLLLFSHGSTGGKADTSPTQRPGWLAGLALERGFVVLAPMRRGRGKSEGSYDERTTCDFAVYEAGLRLALEDTDAALAYAKTLPFVDAGRVVLAGASRGGMLSVAYAARRPGSAVGVVNFVGGWHGVGCAVGFDLAMFTEAGKTTRVPTLWLYAENDRYYTNEMIRGFAKAYADAGGKLQLHLYAFPDGDGHLFYFNRSERQWRRDLGSYLDGLGFPRRH